TCALPISRGLLRRPFGPGQRVRGRPVPVLRLPPEPFRPLLLLPGGPQSLLGPLAFLLRLRHLFLGRPCLLACRPQRRLRLRPLVPALGEPLLGGLGLGPRPLQPLLPFPAPLGEVVPLPRAAGSPAGGRLGRLGPCRAGRGSTGGELRRGR